VGDVSANVVEITPGPNPGQYRIAGLNNTEIDGPTLIENPVDLISVDLGGGSDSFTIKGDGSNKVYVGGNVQIDNSDGLNVNKLIDAEVSGDLIIHKIAGSSESQLEIQGTTIVGDVTVDNAFGGGGGDSKTMITAGSHLQANLDIDNAQGEDVLIVYESNIDGNVDINNGDGDTRTVFGLNEDPIIWGSLAIINGDGNDQIVVHDTEVWLNASINNGDGHTDISVEQTKVGLGVALGNPGDLAITNGAGIDQFRMVQSAIKDDLLINNGAGTFGSRIEILTDSRIGNDFTLTADNGLDRVTVADSTVVDDTTLTLGSGSSEVTFSNAHLQEHLNIAANAGADHVRVEGTTIEGDTDINLGDGVDLLEILAASALQGQTSLEGGSGIDTFWRQLGPATEAIDIAFLNTETFEIDQFQLQ